MRNFPENYYVLNSSNNYVNSGEFLRRVPSINLQSW